MSEETVAGVSKREFYWSDADHMLHVEVKPGKISGSFLTYKIFPNKQPPAILPSGGSQRERVGVFRVRLSSLAERLLWVSR